MTVRKLAVLCATHLDRMIVSALRDKETVVGARMELQTAKVFMHAVSFGSRYNMRPEGLPALLNSDALKD